MKSSRAVVDVVTGATQGIGKAVAEFIASERNEALPTSGKYLLVLVGRNEQRGKQACQAIQQKHSKISVSFESCDLSNWQSVQALPAKIAGMVGDTDFQLGILVNDAAECPKRQAFIERQQKLEEGSIGNVKLDKQFASNVLGYHFMMKAFQNHCSMEEDNGGTNTHIVNVASTWAGDLDLNDVNFQRRSYENDSAYRQSKQCNRMQSCHWSKILHDVALVNACHPGDPCTTLSKDLGYNLFASAPTAEQIARDTPFPFLCGLKPNSVTTTGGWFVGVGTKPYRCGFEQKTEQAQRLFELCESFCV